MGREPYLYKGAACSARASFVFSSRRENIAGTLGFGGSGSLELPPRGWKERLGCAVCVVVCECERECEGASVRRWGRKGGNGCESRGVAPLLCRVCFIWVDRRAAPPLPLGWRWEPILEAERSFWWCWGLGQAGEGPRGCGSLRPPAHQLIGGLWIPLGFEAAEQSWRFGFRGSEAEGRGQPHKVDYCWEGDREDAAWAQAQQQDWGGSLAALSFLATHPHHHPCAS